MKHFYLEKVCNGMSERSGRAAGHIYKESPVGALYRCQFCGQHPVEGMSQPAHPYPQGVPQCSAEGQMLHGMVLRIQAVHRMQ